ncbi:BRI1 kinase inhibitor 1-like [Curcuma longa]|uniref:BRI1 kinase inhibitor 1-like n=1 Tax=Curcuma longa TaxID=136217 RepID=UPI003D9E6A24
MEIEDKATSPPRPPPPPPPSAITSPSHDFSFTISFQALSSPATLRGSADKSPSASSGAFDLAPADDIFLHGHLLPLHLLSHPGSPPRASDISLENFRFPLGHTESDRNLNYFDSGQAAKEESRATKPPSALAAFFGLGKLRKRNEKEGAEAAATTTTKRKRKGLDVIRLLRKYANLLELLFSFRTGERERERERRRREDDLRRRPCSFSGHSNRNSKAEAAAQEEWRRRKKGQMSAPASMRTSPTNSGLLSTSSMTISSTSTSDSSTMEELQSAIQAAIAHCKNSIAVSAKQRTGET